MLCPDVDSGGLNMGCVKDVQVPFLLQWVLQVRFHVLGLTLNVSRQMSTAASLKV